MGEQLLFTALAVLTLGCALIALFHRDVVKSAFSLMGTLIGVAGFYLMLGADFVGMVQILIYVGGILMLLIFGLMLTKPDPKERSQPRILGAAILVGGGAVYFGLRLAGVAAWAGSDLAELPDSTAAEIGLELLRRDHWLLPFELASVLLLAALVGAVYIARRHGRSGV